MKKKILSLVLAAAICTSVAACADASTSGTTGSTVTTVGTGTTSGTTATAGTTALPTLLGMILPEVNTLFADPVTVDLDGIAKLVYNPAYCDVAYKIEDGVGARKNITLSIFMKEGFVFDGWSKRNISGKKDGKYTYSGDAIVNGGEVDSTETTYTYTVTKSQDVTIYANYSAQIKYDPNGGTVAKGGDVYTQKYAVTGFKCPNTLPEQGFFTRAGYTLIEYNTKADGSGVSVSPGSKIALEQLKDATLYCIWEKQNDEADFETGSTGGLLTIRKYKGTSDNVVIPDTIKGKKVVLIAEGAFSGTNVKRVVLSKNITTVEDGAFKDCTKLESFVMYDSVMNISDDCFEGTKIKNLQINAALNLYNNWTVSYAAPKVDRLLWAKATGKKVIAIYGGSGSLYGWDCAAIEKEFEGEYVVVNLGTNANATAAMFFDLFTDVLAKDDVVLWAPEPGEWTFGSTMMGSKSMWGSSANQKSWEINAAHYDIFKSMDISEYTMVFDSYAKYASSHLANQKNYDAFSTSTSVHGDGIDNEEQLKEMNNTNKYKQQYESREELLKDGTLDYMAELIGELSSKGVNVFHTYAAMDVAGKNGINSSYMKNTFEKVFTEKFKGIKVISDIMDCFVPSEQMRDSEWHLTRKGAEIRTKVVIEDLKAALGK